MKPKIQNGHMHAWCVYKPTSWRHYISLFVSVVVGKLLKVQSVTTHIPLELQHLIYQPKTKGEKLIKFGMSVAALFRTKLYWENAPLLNYGTWDLKHGQTEWDLVSKGIPLCLDTGHLILGAASLEEAQKRIRDIIAERGEQIKHLHIHENDLLHDNHRPPEKIVTPEILSLIISGRTYIFEE